MSEEITNFININRTILDLLNQLNNSTVYNEQNYVNIINTLNNTEPQIIERLIHLRNNNMT
jgi:hypothetical protein